MIDNLVIDNKLQIKIHNQKIYKGEICNLMTVHLSSRFEDICNYKRLILLMANGITTCMDAK